MQSINNVLTLLLGGIVGVVASVLLAFALGTVLVSVLRLVGGF